MATQTKARPTRNSRQDAEAKRPVHEVRLGRVVAAIWRNETSVGVRHNVTVSRIYVDEEGQWRRSASFGRDDLPMLAKVLDRAHSWIFDQPPGTVEDAQAVEPEGGQDDIPY